MGPGIHKLAPVFCVVNQLKRNLGGLLRAMVAEFSLCVSGDKRGGDLWKRQGRRASVEGSRERIEREPK